MQGSNCKESGLLWSGKDNPQGIFPCYIIKADKRLSRGGSCIYLWRVIKDLLVIYHSWPLDTSVVLRVPEYIYKLIPPHSN